MKHSNINKYQGHSEGWKFVLFAKFIDKAINNCDIIFAKA